jgi:hypothetical protein
LGLKDCRKYQVGVYYPSHQDQTRTTKTLTVGFEFSAEEIGVIDWEHSMVEGIGGAT